MQLGGKYVDNMNNNNADYMYTRVCNLTYYNDPSYNIYATIIYQSRLIGTDITYRL